MKLNWLTIALAVVGLMTGCEDKSSQQPPPATSAAPANPSSRRMLLTPTVSPAQSKEEFVVATERRLSDLNIEIDSLAMRADNFDGDAKQEAVQALASLRHQRDETQKTFEEVKRAGAATWMKLKEGFDVAMTELEKACENVRAKFG